MAISVAISVAISYFRVAIFRLRGYFRGYFCGYFRGYFSMSKFLIINFFSTFSATQWSLFFAEDTLDPLINDLRGSVDCMGGRFD